MRSRPALSRRRLLQGGLALPALELFGARRALAATPAVPKRLLMVHQPQGTVLADWVPVGTERDFTLPFLLEPLAPWRDRAVFVTGLDNRIAGKNSVGNAHQQAASHQSHFGHRQRTVRFPSQRRAPRLQARPLPCQGRGSCPGHCSGQHDEAGSKLWR